MPIQPTYPGIYIEEIPSGVHTIMGVSTSNTAFVDSFSRGPMNQAVQITSYADFERIFGGLDPLSEASYAIQQYYLNGGQIAWVVRVPGAGTYQAGVLALQAGTPQPALPGGSTSPPASSPPAGDQTGQLVLQGGSPPQSDLTIQAKSPGSWGNNLQVAITSAPAPATAQTPPPPASFNLFVREVATSGGRVQVVNAEAYRNLNMVVGDPNYAVSVVNVGSSLVQLTDSGLGAVPAPTGPASPSGVPADGAFQALANGTDAGLPDSAALIGDPAAKTGMYALDTIDPFIFNLLCIPAAANLDANSMTSVISQAATYCDQKRAMLIVDIPRGVDTPAAMIAWMGQNDGLRNANAAVYFPRLLMPDPLSGNRLRDVGPSGAMAGIYARIDANRGVWKAPAGTEANIVGARLMTAITDLENGELNPLGINVLRNFPIFGNVSWGARTLFGADQMTSQWKYIPVRRMAMYIEDSLLQGLKWVVFEPNDEPLWSQIRLNVGAFMHDLFRQGAFQGARPSDAYLVKCDGDTTTQSDIDKGIVNILVGFAPLKPAEFVILQIEQLAGQLQV